MAGQLCSHRQRGVSAAAQRLVGGRRCARAGGEGVWFEDGFLKRESQLVTKQNEE